MMMFCKKKPKADDSAVREVDLSESALQQLRSSGQVRSNTVRTSKYTWYNFLPINLFEQFSKKAANLYFLIIMFMQMIKVISISNGAPVMALPLAFVVVVSMIKDAYEDYKRHREDRSENYAQAQVYSKEQNQFIAMNWKDI